MNKILLQFHLAGLMFLILANMLVLPFDSSTKNPPANGYLNSIPNWVAESNVADASFGISVASAGDVNKDGFDDVIVGASSYNYGNEPPIGRVFVYYGSADGLNTVAGPSPRSRGTTFLPSGFGAIVASGDVNGDGYNDVFVGAPTMDQFFGEVCLYLGSDTGTAVNPASIFTFPHARFNFGLSLASAGDLNGDGYCDVIVGNPTYQNIAVPFSPVAPRALVYYGSPNGLSNAASRTFPGGFRVAAAGDVNNDGFDDVIVDNNLYLGSDTGVHVTPAATWIMGNEAAAADVNKDGFDDIIVGQPDSNRVFLYLGCDTGLNASPAWEAHGQTNSMFGSSVASAGDVDNDGYADVIVGAPNYHNAQDTIGRIYLYNGSATGLSGNAVWAAEGDQSMANFGRSVSSAGDVNGDGFSDAVIGAPDYGNPESNEGRAFTYYGQPGLAVALPMHLLEFTGSLAGNGTVLRWITASELTTCCFEIERSENGINFIALARVKARGNSPYSFHDAYNFSEIIYYRLKIIDADEKFAYSSIVALRKTKHEYWEINPSLLVQGHPLKLMIQALENKNITLRIIDMDGRMVMVSQLTVEKGSHLFLIAVNLRKGGYLVRLAGLKDQQLIKRLSVK